MDFHISLVGRRDLAGEIYRQLRRAIVERRLRPGDLLPSSRELARRLRVSRTTVSTAYDRLAGDNLVTSRVRSGTFVSNAPHAVDQPKLASGRHAGVLRARAIWDTFELSTAFAREAQLDFRTGLPDASLFPYGRWRRAVAAAYRDELRGGAKYSEPSGDRDLRESIARHIGLSRGVETSADDVMVTSGAQQAIDIVSRVLLAPGDVVAVEDPGYAPPRRLFASLGLRVVGVPVDDRGLVTDALPKAHLAYVTPSHQYPLGVSMALPRRIALLEWAERNDVAIIEDDYDSEFRFGGRPLEPLHTIDRRGRVIYVGTFSKSLLPALRLGFVVTPPALRTAMRKAKQVTDWHSSMVAQRGLARFMKDGTFARHVRRMARIYAARHELTVKSFNDHLGKHFQLLPSDTGLHIAAVAKQLSVAEVEGLARRASALGVEVQTLSQFAVGPAARAGLVLGYGGIPPGKIAEGLTKLAQCVCASGSTSH